MSDKKDTGQGADKKDTGKNRWDLLPVRPLREVVRVLGFGANKYVDDGWQNVTDGRRRYYAAAMRHISDWWGGEKIDPESGLHHLAHAACSLLFVLWHDTKEESTTSEIKPTPLKSSNGHGCIPSGFRIG